MSHSSVNRRKETAGVSSITRSWTKSSSCPHHGHGHILITEIEDYGKKFSLFLHDAHIKMYVWRPHILIPEIQYYETLKLLSDQQLRKVYVMLSGMQEITI